MLGRPEASSDTRMGKEWLDQRKLAHKGEEGRSEEMLLLELVEILSFLITRFALVALARRMLIKFHGYREIVDGTDKTYS